MSVHVDQVQTNVVPTSMAREDQKTDDQQRPGAAEAWAEHYRLAQRNRCRTTAHDFDD